MFTMLGYDVHTVAISEGEVEVNISKGKFAISLTGVESMHDSLYSVFIDMGTVRFNDCLNIVN